jgi:predicted RNase H-like nuclease
MVAGMRVTGVDACRGGWVAVSLDGPGAATVRVHETLTGLLGPDANTGTGTGTDTGTDTGTGTVTGIDMPLGLLGSGWREADRAARGLLGPRRSSVFAIPPRPVWEQASYQAASACCRELTGQGFSIQAWGLRAKLLEADRYLQTCGHPLYEVHPELAFGAMAGAPLAHSKHTEAGRDQRRELLSRAGIALPAGRLAPVTDTLDAAAVAWSARRIAAGQAVVLPAMVLPAAPQRDSRGREIAIRY